MYRLSLSPTARPPARVVPRIWLGSRVLLAAAQARPSHVPSCAPAAGPHASDRLVWPLSEHSPLSLSLAGMCALRHRYEYRWMDGVTVPLAVAIAVA